MLPNFLALTLDVTGSRECAWRIEEQGRTWRDLQARQPPACAFNYLDMLDVTCSWAEDVTGGLGGRRDKWNITSGQVGPIH